MSMLIAQITDMHIGTGDDIAAEENYDRLLAVTRRLARMRRKPDLILATGDLTETGTTDAYKLLKRMFGDIPQTILPCLGNHDIAHNFRSVFGDGFFNAGFCQYTYDAGPLTIVTTDTHDETIHGGDFCAERADWLDRALTACREKPAIVALHHPPFVSGIDWMGARERDEAWLVLLRDVVSRHPHVLKVVGGHIHRAIDRPFAGTSCFVCAATAAQVDLELAPITATTADGRPLIIDEPPGFALHWFDGTELVSHHGVAGDYDVILEYHERFRQVMRDVFRVPD